VQLFRLKHPTQKKGEKHFAFPLLGTLQLFLTLSAKSLLAPLKLSLERLVPEVAATRKLKMARTVITFITIIKRFNLQPPPTLTLTDLPGLLHLLGILLTFLLF
jgi:hypothetical protein